MNFKSKWKKSLIVVAVASVVAVSMLSSVVVIGLQSVQKPSNNPWDYTMLATGNNISIVSTVNELSVTGDIRSNGSISMQGNKADISGNLLASGDIKSNVTTTDIGRLKSEVDIIDVNNVFDRIFDTAMENSEPSYLKQIKEQTYMIQNPIISNDSLTISISRNNPSSSTDTNKITDKFGVFGAGFLTKAYENPALWGNVLPIFSEENLILPGDSGQLDVLDLGKKSTFIPVSEQSVSDIWENADRLASEVFQQYFRPNNVSNLITNIKSSNELFSICSQDSIQLHCGYDNSTINPILVENVSSLIASEGNLTLDGDYDIIEEIRLDNWGGSQLMGSYPNLKYIYKTSWGNLNLAGDFPSLEGVYLPGGQLLLGNGDYGFSASNADFINENGIIIVYTANDVNLTNCRLMTNQSIVFRGEGKDAETSKFDGNNSLFVAGGTLAFEDMHDNLTTEFRKVPVFYSYAPMSFVNSSFELLQGCFISANGAMTLTETSIQSLRGYLLSPYGINEYPSNSSACVYIDTYNYNISPNIRSLNTQQNGIWHLGNVTELSPVAFPETLASEICNISDFLADCRKVKNENGEYEEVYQIGNATDHKGLLALNSHLIAEGDIQINAEQIISTDNEKHVIASKNGDITVSVIDAVDMDCIIYAPNGKVTIDGSGTIQGRIFAREIEVIGKQLAIIGDDVDVSKLGFVDPDQSGTSYTNDSVAEEPVSSTEKDFDETEVSSEEISDKTEFSSDENTSDELESTETDTKETKFTEMNTDMTETTTLSTTEKSEYTNVEYIYDKLGRLVKVIYDDSHYVEYQYDANGNIIRVEKSEEE